MGGAVTALLSPYSARHFGWSASFLVVEEGIFPLGSVASLLVDSQRVCDGDRHASAVSSNEGGRRHNGLLSPYIARHFGWNASFLVAAGLCALGTMACLLVDPEHQPDARIPEFQTS